MFNYPKFFADPASYWLVKWEARSATTSAGRLVAAELAATGVARDPGPRDLIMLPATSAMAGVYAVESCAPDLGGMCRITTARAEALAVRSVPQAT